MVWEIDGACSREILRPIICHQRSGTCMPPWVKIMTILTNGMYQRLADGGCVAGPAGGGPALIGAGRCS